MKKYLFIILGVSLIIIIVALLVGEITGRDVKEPKEVYKERDNTRDRNGAVANIWLNGRDRLDILRDNKIEYLFVDVGDTSLVGLLTTNEKEIVRFLGMIEDYEEENNYEFILLPYSEINTYVYDITSEEFKNNFAYDYERLEVLGFDGVYIDVEPVGLELIDDYLDLIDRVKSKSSFVGVYSGSFGEEGNEWSWSPYLFKEVDEKVELIFVPGYDTGMESKEEYKKHIESQLNDISNLKLESILLLGVPTHKKNPEKIENALQVYSAEKNAFDGVAIFSEWTSSRDEWETFRDYF
jgi:hypothetical protein